MTDKELEEKIAAANFTLPPNEQWENLTLANDILFGWIMCDADMCSEMLRRILPELDIGQIISVNTQKGLRNTIDTYGVRLDIYAVSHSGKVYNIEIQTTNNKDLPRRTRAYHIMMGSEVLKKNKDILSRGVYDNMPDSYVIFICTFDPFSEGRHIYTFRKTCRESTGLELNDGEYTIFLNTKSSNEDINFELLALLELINGRIIVNNDPYINELVKRLEIAKQDHRKRLEYMWEEMRRRELIGRGIAVGRTQVLNRASEMLSKLAGQRNISDETAELLNDYMQELEKMRHE